MASRSDCASGLRRVASDGCHRAAVSPGRFSWNGALFERVGDSFEGVGDAQKRQGRREGQDAQTDRGEVFVHYAIRMSAAGDGSGSAMGTLAESSAHATPR